MSYNLNHCQDTKILSRYDTPVTHSLSRKLGTYRVTFDKITWFHVYLR